MEADDSDHGLWPLEQKSILTATESEFYKRLKKALPEYSIHTQMSLGQMLEVKKGENIGFRNHFSKMAIDFVVVSDEDHRIVAAIELDDKTHDIPERKAADERKDKACASGGIRLIRWHAENMPSVEDIRNKVLDTSTLIEVNKIVPEPREIRIDTFKGYERRTRKRRKPQTFENMMMLLGVKLGVAAIGGIIFYTLVMGMMEGLSKNMIDRNIKAQAAIKQKAEEEKQAQAENLARLGAADSGQIKNPQAEQEAVTAEWGRMHQSGQLIQHRQKPAISISNEDGKTSTRREGESEDCQSWRSSNIIEPTENKKEYLRANCGMQ